MSYPYPYTAVQGLRGQAYAMIRAAEVLERLPIGPVIGAEIGVFSGRMSRALLSHPSLTLVMVDAWESDAYIEPEADWHASLTQYQQEKYMQAALSNTAFAGERRRVVKARSVPAAGEIEDASLHFAFLDADHSEQGCRTDLEAWWPKIRNGCFICGHDYGNPQFPGVKSAVDTFAAKAGLALSLGLESIWFMSKA